MKHPFRVVVGFLIALLLVIVVVFQAILGNVAGCITNVAVNGATAVLKSFSPVQLGNLALIDRIGQELGLAEKDRATGMAVAIQESKARNIRFGHLDSLGLFQQRPGVMGGDGKPYWGTAEQILDPNYSIRRFYKELMSIEGREFMTPLQIALKVQRPSEEAYKSPDNYFPGWVDDALAFIRGAVNSPPGSGTTTSNVATNEQANTADLCSIDLSGLSNAIPRLGSAPPPGQLLYPTYDTTVDSPYGMRFHPILRYWKLHNGADFAVPCGTPVKASADGIVKIAQVQGSYGEYIQIDHGGGIQTGYAHLQAFASGIKPDADVDAGQVIGEVGNTGRSTGCHLHHVKYAGGKPVNPVPYSKG